MRDSKEDSLKMNDNLDNNNVSFNADSAADDTVSGVEKAPKKKTGAKIAAVGIGAVVLLAGGGVAAYNLSDFVKNKVKLAVLEPEEYYSWVTEKSAAESAETISKSYERYIDALSDGQRSSLSLKYEISDEVRSLLLNEFLGSSYESSANDEMQSYIDIINNINSIELGVDSAVKSDIISGTVYGNVNDEKLVSADVAMNYGDLSYYFRVPELTEKWIGMALGDYMESSNNAAFDFSKDFTKNPEDFLSAEELEELINKYTAVWCNEIDDVELEKKEKVDIGDITVEYTVITAEIDGKKAYEIADAFLDEASGDKLLKEIVTERIGAVSEEEYDSFFEEAKSSLEAEKDSMTEDDETVELITYVDQKGTVRGMSLEVPDEEGKLSYIIGLEDDDVYGEFIFADGSEGISAVLNAEKNGKTYDGEIEIKNQSGSSILSIEFDDFEIVNEEKCYANGDVRIIVQNIAPISLELSSDGKSQDISVDLDFAGTNYGKLMLSMSEDKADDVSMPDVSGALMIDPENAEADLESYVTEEEIADFIKELLVKLGFSEEDSKLIAESAASEIFEPDYDYDYDWDNDDYDYDWDDDDYDWGNDSDWDGDFDYDEWQNPDNTPNPDAANAVAAEDGQAYLYVMDYYWDAEYWGYDDDSLAYKAGVATINGNGQYTVSVTADTDGYRFERTGDVKDASKLPDGLDYLSVCINDYHNAFVNAVIKVDSVKIDGKSVPITGTNFTTSDSGYETEAVIYCDWYGDIPTDARVADGDASKATAAIIDGADIETWTSIEVTFTVSGL